MVYVLSKTGQPLMPTSNHRKVRLLLESGKAKVVRRTPFTIQLQYTSHTYKQNVSLGVDTGSKVIGLSATTNKQELFAEEVTIRNDIVKLLSVRSQHRHGRRSRTTRYRKRRTLNRSNSKQKGWLSPAIKAKIFYHIKVIDRVHQILPINNIIIETSAFDMQKIVNPDIIGDEYTKGPQLGFLNVREYVLSRDNHECQICHGKSKDPVLNVHHIESRRVGGNSPTNLITLCKTCHHKLHSGEITTNFKRKRPLRDAAFMSILKSRLYNLLKNKYKNVKETFGYITKAVRISNNLPKDHCVDARCISNNPLAKESNVLYIAIVIRRHNRRIHQDAIRKGGTRKIRQLPKYVLGYRMFDKVRCDKGEGCIFARRSSGYFDIRHLNNERMYAGGSYKKIKLIERSNTLPIEGIKRNIDRGDDDA